MPPVREKIGYKRRANAVSHRKQISAALLEIKVAVAGTDLADYIPEMTSSRNPGYEYIHEKAGKARAWAFGKDRKEIVAKIDKLINLLETRTK